MNYEEFKQSLLERLEENKPDNVLMFKTFSRPRTNEDSTEILTLMYRDFSNLAPIFYLKDMYAALEQGMYEIEEYVADIIDYVKRQQYEDRNFDIDDICIEKADECLKLRLYNREWNQNIERSCAHINMVDLIAVPVWETHVKGESGTIVVDKGLQRDILKMTDDELLGAATRNTLNEKFVLKTMDTMLRESMSEEDQGFLDELVPNDVMYVLTNEDVCLGSTAIFSKNVLKMAQEKLGENYFVLPSSIHETILVRESKVDSPEALKEVVESVNVTVSQKELLSENVYRFNGRHLQVCNTMQDWKMQIEREQAQLWQGRNMERRVGL